MDVKLNQVIYHLLDSGASEPVLSDRPMDLDADLFEYFTACIEKAWASDEGKACQFLPDSAFLAEMRQNSDFIDLSRRIAGVIFEQQLQYPGIPSGDLAVADCSMDGVPFYAAETEHSLTIWGCMVLLGIVQFGFSYIFLSKGLDRVSPVTASLTSTIEPILNPLLVALFYGETIGSTAVIGAVLVVGASTAYNVFDASKKTKKQKESREAGALT